MRDIIKQLGIKRSNYKIYEDFDHERSLTPIDYIGASECGKLFYIDGFVDLVYNRINNIDPFKDVDESVKIKMRMGKALENLAANIMAEQEQHDVYSYKLNKKRDGSDFVCFLESCKYKNNIGATPDGFVFNFKGEMELLEIKTSGSLHLKNEIKTFIESGVMEISKTLHKYYSQCQFGMYLTGLKKAKLFVLFFTGDYCLVNIDFKVDWVDDFYKSYTLFVRSIQHFKGIRANRIMKLDPIDLKDDHIVNKEEIHSYVDSKWEISREEVKTLVPVKTLNLEDIGVSLEDIEKYKEELNVLNNVYQEQKDNMNKNYREGMKSNNILTSNIYNKIKDKIKDGVYKVDNHIIVVNSSEHFINKRVKII